MTEYLVSIWNRYLEEHPHTRTLPAIVPLVVHSAAHGRPWNTPTELSELIDLDPGTRTTLGDHVPSLRLFLDDLTTVDLETLRERPLTPAARLVFVFHKIVPGNAHLGTDLLAQIPDLQAVIEAPGSLDDLRSLVKYIFLVGETSEDDLAPVIDQLGPRAKEVVMTTAEQLRAKGHAEGLAEGQAEALTDLLTIKFGPLPIEVTDQIAKAEVTQLRTWLRSVLTATTLDEVFDHA